MIGSCGSEIDSVDQLLLECTTGVHYRRLNVTTSPAGSPITVPLNVVIGSIVGPRLVLLSGVHGDEGLGPLALGRFLAEVDPSRMAGSVITVPVCNPPAFEQRTRVNSWDGGDLHRLWPGRPDGSITERMAAALFAAVTPGATALVDLHSGTSVLHEYWVVYANHNGPRAAIASDVERRSLDLARAFGVSQIIRRHPWYGTHMAAGNAGIPSVLADIGGGADYLQNDRCVGTIVRGITNTMRHLAMLPGEPQVDGPARVFDIAEEFIAAADTGGFWIRAVEPGQHVTRGTTVGTFVDPSTGREIKRLRSGVDGVILNPTAASPHIGHGQWLLAIGTPVDAASL